MATLSAAQQAAAQAGFTQDLMAAAETIGIAKPDLAAAVAALDSFLDTNAAAINNAIPLPARTALTTRQKARLLRWVITQRYLAS